MLTDPFYCLAVSMMAVGPTGVGKSSLLNSLLCPAKWSTEFEDCHFETDSSFESVTKSIKKIVGPWLDDTEAPELPLVKVFDTPGLGDTDGLSDAHTLKNMIELINSEPVSAILLVFKANDRFGKHIQKQLRTLEYILGSQQLWDHVIIVFTFWGFGASDIKDRVTNCIKERKKELGENVRTAKKICGQFDFETEKVGEMTESFKKYLGVEKRFPYAFPHPVFDYEDQGERRIFFENAMKIYDSAKTMSPLQCDPQCERRLEMALKRGKKTPFVLGKELQRFDDEKKIELACHLYLGLGNSTAKEIKWWHNSSTINTEDSPERNIQVEEEILLDVIKESRLTILIATFDDAGTYGCFTTEDRKVAKSPEVTIKVLPRKYDI